MRRKQRIGIHITIHITIGQHISISQPKRFYISIN